jgi:hypothetical protein
MRHFFYGIGFLGKEKLFVERSRNEQHCDYAQCTTAKTLKKRLVAYMIFL